MLRYDNTIDAMFNVFLSIPEKARKSVTMDNGTEFAKHYELTDKLGILTYFAGYGVGVCPLGMHRRNPHILCTSIFFL